MDAHLLWVTCWLLFKCSRCHLTSDLTPQQSLLLNYTKGMQRAFVSSHCGLHTQGHAWEIHSCALSLQTFCNHCSPTLCSY